MQLNADDHDRIAEAIAKAEQSTSGEIFCVMARQSATYLDVYLVWAAAITAIASLGLIWNGFDATHIPGLGSGWQNAHLAATPVSVSQSLAALVLVQVIVFVIVIAISRIPIMARAMVPSPIRADRVRRAALQQFLAHGLQNTQARTGILIYAAVAEHKVEIVADEGIHSTVDEDVWVDVVSALTNSLKQGHPVPGFEAAVALCGQVLAAHFPPGSVNPDELANRLVEL